MSRKNRDRGASREIDWDWWVYSVGINFLPLLASMLGNFYQYDVINMSALMGSGELVMCAFLILLVPMRELKNFPQKDADWNFFSFLVEFLIFLEAFRTCAKIILLMRLEANPTPCPPPLSGEGERKAQKRQNSDWIRFFCGLSMLVPPSLKGKGDRGKGSLAATIRAVYFCASP